MSPWREILNLNVQVYQSIEGSQLRGFLKGQVKKEVPHFLFEGAKELIVSDEVPLANPSYSLSLLVYAGLSPAQVSLGEKFESVLPKSNHHAALLASVETFFRGNSLQLPKNNALDAQFKSFDQWTAVNEVKHISLWLLAALRSLYGQSLPSSLEVEIPLPGEARPGRLDVVAKPSENIICFEAKTSISDAIKDRRFIEQVPKYRGEIALTAEKLGLVSKEPLIYLATGGNETDIKSRDFQVQTTPVGMKLLEICETHNIKFITANAVWQILAMKLVSPEKYLDLETILVRLNETKDFLGLSSGGFIRKDLKVISPLTD